MSPMSTGVAAMADSRIFDRKGYWYRISPVLASRTRSPSPVWNMASLSPRMDATIGVE